MSKGTTVIGGFIAIIIAFSSGFLFKKASTLGMLLFAFILFCCSAGIVGYMIEKSLAANRTAANPITSFDQKGAIGAGALLMGIFAIAGYMVG